VIESSCLAAHRFFVMLLLKGNVRQNKARAGRRKMSFQVTLLEIKAIADLKLSGIRAGVICIYFCRFWG